MKDNIKKPELLAPAGDMERLKTACAYGADAVYISGNKFGLRAKAKNFSYEEMAEAVEYAHKMNVKVYITVNIFAHNEDFDKMGQYLTGLKEINADALIVSDPGIFSLAREIIPDMEIHISTQANSTNYKSVLFWQGLGAKRIVLARELSLDEISKIKKMVNGTVELEAFIHGAMCISYSGRCLLSNYLSGRDSNRGLCSHPCRWEYRLSELSREGEYFPVEEDERGTYIFNSKDLCMIEHIPELIGCGLDSLKIEGRMKTPYYVAAVVKAYRQALDDYFMNPDIYFSRKKFYLDEILKSSNRAFTTGFYFSKPDSGAQIYNGESYIRKYDFIGAVTGYDAKTGLAKIEQRNKFIKGDTVEFLSPDKDNFSQEITEMYNDEMQPIEEAPHPQQTVYIKTVYPVKYPDLMRKKL